MNYVNTLPDGWTIYVWLIAGALIIVAVIFGIRWAARNNQFDEDIKYLVFDKDDKDKMSPEEFAKSQRVLAEQTEERTRYLAEKDRLRKAHHRS